MWLTQQLNTPTDQQTHYTNDKAIGQLNFEFHPKISANRVVGNRLGKTIIDMLQRIRNQNELLVMAL